MDFEEVMDNYKTLDDFRQWLNMDREHDEFFYVEMIRALAEKVQCMQNDKKGYGAI